MSAGAVANPFESQAPQATPQAAQAATGVQNPFGDPSAQQSQQSQSQQSQSQQSPDDGWQQAGDAVESGVANLGAGIAKGAMQTVNTVSKGLHAIPYIGEYLAPQAGIDSASDISKPTGTMQKIGVGAESIAEMLLGDEALKGLSLADKLTKISKVAETYENASSFVKAAIEHGLQAARGAVLTGGETAAKGGDIKDVAEAAAAGGVAGSAASVAGKVLPKIWSTVTGKAIQNNLQDGIRSVVSDVADSAGVEAPTATVNRSVEGLADSVQAKSKGLFTQIDEATEGEYTNLQNQLRNVENEITHTAGIDSTKDENLFNQKVALKAKLDEAFNQAVKNGVDPKVADQAREAWKQMSALRDIDAAVKASTDIWKGGEFVDPNKLAPRLKKLDDTGRLTEGLGDSANDLLQTARDARDQLVSRGGKIAATKMVGKVAGGAAIAGTLGGAALHSVLGGHN